MEQDLYLILEVEPSADAAVIKSAYRRLAKQFHPDVNASPDALQRMKSLNHAYQVLSDPKARERYDVRRERAGYGHAGTRRRHWYEPAEGGTRARPGTSAKKGGDAARKTRPKRRRKRKQPPVENIVPEEHIAQAAALWKVMPRLTVERVADRLGIEEHPAARVFDVLVARKIIDLKGYWLVRRDAGGNGAGAKRTSHRETEEQQRARTMELADAAIRKLRLSPTVTVPLLSAHLGISTEQAMRVFAMLVERKIIDANGVWEPRVSEKVKRDDNHGR